MKSLQVTDPQDPGNHSDGIDQVSDKSIVIPNQLITVADSFKHEKSWQTTTRSLLVSKISSYATFFSPPFLCLYYFLMLIWIREGLSPPKSPQTCQSKFRKRLILFTRCVFHITIQCLHLNVKNHRTFPFYFPLKWPNNIFPTITSIMYTRGHDKRKHCQSLIYHQNQKENE